MIALLIGSVCYEGVDSSYAATKTSQKIATSTTKKTTAKKKTTNKKTPSKVTGLVAKKSSAKIVKLTWEKAKNADMYEIYFRSDENMKWKKAKTTNGESISVKNSCKIEQNQVNTFDYKVRAINGKKKGKFSSYARIKLPVTNYKCVDLPSFGSMYSFGTIDEYYDEEDDYFYFAYEDFSPLGWIKDEYATSYYYDYLDYLTNECGWKYVSDSIHITSSVTKTTMGTHEEISEQKKIVTKNGVYVHIMAVKYNDTEVLNIESVSVKA